MGFYLAIPYLFYRGRKKFIARSFLITGLLYGTLIGIARMMAGGHFERFPAFLHFSIQKGGLMIRSNSESLKLIGNKALIVDKRHGKPHVLHEKQIRKSKQQHFI